MGANSRMEGTGANLGEGMVSTIGCDHVVPGLRTTIEPDHGGDGPGCTQPVDHGALAGIAIAEVNHDRVQAHSRRTPPVSLAAVTNPAGVGAVTTAPLVAASGARARDTLAPAVDPPSARSARPVARSMDSSPRPTIRAMVSQTASRSSSSMTFWPS